MKTQKLDNEKTVGIVTFPRIELDPICEYDGASKFDFPTMFQIQKIEGDIFIIEHQPLDKIFEGNSINDVVEKLTQFLKEDDNISYIGQPFIKLFKKE